jgi:hypothetical protein
MHRRMDYLRLQNRVRKICALAAAALILPALAYAGGQGGNSQGGGGGGNSQGGGTYTVPEGGPGMVLLITTVGAMLLFSARGSSREKAAKNGR